MNKEFNYTKIEEFKLSVETSSEITFKTSDTDELIVKADYSDDFIHFKEKTENQYYRLKVKNSRNEFTNTEEIIKGIKNIISNLSVKNFGTVLEELFTNTKKINIRITIYLPSSLKTLKLDLNDAEVLLDSVAIQKFRVDANNVRLKMTGNSFFTEAEFFLNNCKIKIPVKNNEQSIFVDTNNSKIKLIKSDSYSGEVFCKGNQMKIYGAKSTSNKDANVKISGNNCKIEVVD